MQGKLRPGRALLRQVQVQTRGARCSREKVSDGSQAGRRKDAEDAICRFGWPRCAALVQSHSRDRRLRKRRRADCAHLQTWPRRRKPTWHTHPRCVRTGDAADAKLAEELRCRRWTPEPGCSACSRLQKKEPKKLVPYANETGLEIKAGQGPDPTRSGGSAR